MQHFKLFLFVCTFPVYPVCHYFVILLSIVLTVASVDGPFLAACHCSWLLMLKIVIGCYLANKILCLSHCCFCWQQTTKCKISVITDYRKENVDQKQNHSLNGGAATHSRKKDLFIATTGPVIEEIECTRFWLIATSEIHAVDSNLHKYVHAVAISY